MKEKYFAASNSSEGFCSYYDEAFNPEKLYKIYVIKGGSGTGKAFFMKEIAKAAELYGFSVRYIYCSSDAQSLDGIIINEQKIAVLDGTSPHVYEPKYIGAVEVFVNLAEFLDEKMLTASRKIIEKASKEKQMGFEAVYRNLNAYHKLSENIEKMVLPCIKLDKIRKYVKRFSEGLEREDGNEEHLLTRAIGMRGLSSFDTYFERASIYYEINDYFESAHFLMREIYEALKEKNINLKISSNPIIRSRVDALSVVQNGLTFEIGNRMDESVRLINMKRFVDNDEIAKIRQDYRTVARVRDSVLDLTLAEFEKIKKSHFLLEEIYGSAMDFAAKEQFTREFSNKIFEKN
ncbi:MAG: hypothetical protein IKA84_05240 [Clostridia bacterium]|nr:hypothetical protein [Clostridia bacterium]